MRRRQGMQGMQDIHDTAQHKIVNNANTEIAHFGIHVKDLAPRINKLLVTLIAFGGSPGLY